MSCASSHAVEKYKFVFHVPRRKITYLISNIKEVDTLNWSGSLESLQSVWQSCENTKIPMGKIWFTSRYVSEKIYFWTKNGQISTKISQYAPLHAPQLHTQSMRLQIILFVEIPWACPVHDFDTALGLPHPWSPWQPTGKRAWLKSPVHSGRF